MNICTRCKKEFDYPPAISRVDNEAALCRVCSASEALEAVEMSSEEMERVLAEVLAHENG